MPCQQSQKRVFQEQVGHQVHYSEHLFLSKTNKRKYRKGEQFQNLEHSSTTEG